MTEKILDAITTALEAAQSELKAAEAEADLRDVAEFGWKAGFAAVDAELYRRVEQLQVARRAILDIR